MSLSEKARWGLCSKYLAEYWFDSIDDVVDADDLESLLRLFGVPLDRVESVVSGHVESRRWEVE